MNRAFIEIIVLPHDTSDPFGGDYRKYPQSIRALRTAPGPSKLIAYLIAQPRSFLQTCTEWGGVRAKHCVARMEKERCCSWGTAPCSCGTATKDFAAGARQT